MTSRIQGKYVVPGGRCVCTVAMGMPTPPVVTIMSASVVMLMPAAAQASAEVDPLSMRVTDDATVGATPDQADIDVGVVERFRAANLAAESATTPVEPGTIEVEARVLVTFEVSSAQP